MKNIYYLIIFILLLLSCNSKNNRINIDAYSKISIDSVNFLLDSIMYSLESGVTKYSDTLLASVDLTQFPDTTSKGLPCIDMKSFFSMIEAIKNKDIENYLYSFERRSCVDRINYTPYALHMSKSTDNSEVLWTVYLSLSSLNRFRKKELKPIDNDIHLDELSKGERDLAIYSLIKSFRKGNKSASFFLALYFANGIYYFPKAPLITYKLESVFYEEMEIDYYPGEGMEID
ncbi:hypothetical protein LJC28_04010 [Dysgonomonas sp. OttesenSCG-928-D17]|nr:hypothetical protein [Dysgonomonas sp. OttesenSCG-928-D17]